MRYIDKLARAITIECIKGPAPAEYPIRARLWEYAIGQYQAWYGTPWAADIPKMNFILRGVPVTIAEA